MTRSSATPPATVGAAAIFRTAAIAAVVVALLNTLIFYLGTMSPEVLNPMGQPIGLGAVLGLSVVPVFVGAALLLGLLRWAPGRALPIFWGLAALVVVLFGIGPFSLGAPGAMVWTLQLMHLVVAVPTVWLLTRAVRA